MSTTVARALVVAAARALLRTPYVPQGRVAGEGGGVDCIGVPILVARELGLVAPDFDITGYGLHPDGSMLRYCAEHLVPIARAQMGHGDVLVVAWGDEQARHVGIVAPHSHYAGHDSLIHARPKSGMVVEHRLAFDHFMRFVAAFRFPGVG
jgi:cell wall-associated NlpC family hydrolase